MIPGEEKVQEVVREAQEAFWAAVVKHFPECKTGDSEPLEALRFSMACEKAIKQWLTWNHPEIYVDIDEVLRRFPHLATK